ncbi:hypothetical protein V7S76_12705 [Aquirufa sp. ROCK2-A2]
MILITLAGDSSRFFKEGYAQVKYKLDYGDKSIIATIVDYIPRNEKLLIVLNKKYHDYDYINNLLIQMRFREYKIVEIENTIGQFDTVIQGLSNAKEFWTENDSLTVYNGDTIRKINQWTYDECDGHIEVFHAEGNHWSFVDNIGVVKNVTEKQRISNYCSSGLYFFNKIKYIIDFGPEYMNSAIQECYVAPFYNVLINKGLIIKSDVEDIKHFVFCGTPNEYVESVKIKAFYEKPNSI